MGEEVTVNMDLAHKKERKGIRVQSIRKSHKIQIFKQPYIQVSPPFTRVETCEKNCLWSSNICVLLPEDSSDIQ